MHDLAYEAMNKRTQPSFGWWIDQGATTTWEQWNGDNSRNHPMFGGSLVWFYRKLAGMNADPEAPGYRHIFFRPQPVADLSFVRYFTQTSYGEAGISWKKDDQQFSMKVMVPIGCEATVYVPLWKGEEISENGRPITGSDELRFVEEKEGCRVFKVKSGSYQFLSK